jgi:phage-related protein
VWNTITGFIRDHWKIIVAVITGPLGALVIFVISHWNTIKNTIVNAFNTVISAARAFPGMILRAVGNGLTVLVGFGADIVRGLWNGIKSLGSWIWNQVKSIIPGWIKDALGIHSMPQWAIDAGKWILRGIAHGVTKLPGFLAHLTKNALSKIAELAKSIGGGLPLAAFGTHKRVMDLISDHKEAWSFQTDDQVLFRAG